MFASFLSHTWLCRLKLSRRCSAPQWFIKASTACLCSIMALNPSLPQYCHNGNMCVVIHLNVSDTIAGAPPLPPCFLHKHAHARTHASTLWCTYTRWLRLYSLVQSFEEPPPRTAESISFALIISHKRCVWLWCPWLLYARDASYRSPCVTYNQLWSWLYVCVNKYRQFSHIHNILCFWGFFFLVASF